MYWYPGDRRIAFPIPSADVSGRFQVYIICGREYIKISDEKRA